MNAWLSFLGFITRRIRINRRSKCIITAFIVLFILDVNIEIFLNIYLNNKISQSEIDGFTNEFNELDNNVNTSNYNEEYQMIQQKRKLYKSRKDMSNIEVKTIKLNARPNEARFKKSYLILEYTKIFDNTKYCQLFDEFEKQFGPEANFLENMESINEIYLNQCPYKNCRFTCDKEKVNVSDALLFHYSDLYKSTLIGNSEVVQLTESLKESRIKNNQIWILWNDEPADISQNVDKYNFNWSLSFRFDSEVSDCAYGCTYLKRNLKSSEVNKTALKFVEYIRKEFKERKNQAVWFVSNCNSMFRINYYIRLHKYFPIKVFGNCAKHIESKLDKFEANTVFWLKYYFDLIIEYLKKFFSIITFILNKQKPKEQCNRNSYCEQKNMIENKFYLAFESSNCSNYITEKLWRTLNTNMIPIVIQPAKKYYQMVAPPNSFIHAEDFNYDANRLAKYLHKVSNNFDLYLKHLSWKFNYDVVYSAKQTERRRMCELCTNLNTEKSIIYYESISTWSNGNCFVNKD